MIKMKYKKPFFWPILKLFFPAYDPEGTVAVAFGRIVYANQEIDEHYKVHEATHLKQHRHSYFFAVIWWIKYLFSKKFRYEQELEAFAVQYQWIKKHWPKNKHQDILLHLSGQLSSELYGSMVDIYQARINIISYGKS